MRKRRTNVVSPYHPSIADDIAELHATSDLLIDTLANLTEQPNGKVWAFVLYTFIAELLRTQLLPPDASNRVADWFDRLANDEHPTQVFVVPTRFRKGNRAGGLKQGEKNRVKVAAAYGEWLIEKRQKVTAKSAVVWIADKLKLHRNTVTTHIDALGLPKK